MQRQRVLGGNRRPFMCLYLSELPGSIRNTLGNWINNWIGLACLGFSLGFLLEVFLFFFFCLCLFSLFWVAQPIWGGCCGFVVIFFVGSLYKEARRYDKVPDKCKAVFWTFPEHDLWCMLHKYTHIYIYIYFKYPVYFSEKYSHSLLLKIISGHFCASHFDHKSFGTCAVCVCVCVWPTLTACYVIECMISATTTAKADGGGGGGGGG